MVIEYKIKFDDDGVTVTQSVDPGTDQGGGGPGEDPSSGGGGPGEDPSSGGGGPGEDPNKGGGGPGEDPTKGGGPGDDPSKGGGGRRGRVMAVVLGPLIIGNVGPARAATKRKGESVKNPAVAGPGTILPRREGGPVPAVPAVPAKPPTR
jgi:hypothetical protein